MVDQPGMSGHDNRREPRSKLPMTRRELVTLVCGAAAAAGCDPLSRWSGALPSQGALLSPNRVAGHRLRPGGDAGRSFDWQTAAALPRRKMPVVIVGAGVAGLAAAMEFRRRGFGDFRLLELEPVVGGTARGGQSSMLGGPRAACPWGAHYLPVPSPANEPLVRWLSHHGIVKIRDGAVFGAEQYLVRAPAERVFAGGRWHPGLIPPADEDSDRRRFEAAMVQLAGSTGNDGRPHFSLPRSSETRQPSAIIRRLDTISMADWLTQNDFRDPGLLAYLDHACRDDYGLPADQTSAWAGVFYFAARIAGPDRQPAEILTWPAGNAFLVDRLRLDCGDAIKTDCMVLATRRRGTTIELATDREVWLAEQVIFATPAHVTAAIAPPQDGVTGVRPEYGSWLVANIALSDRPVEPGYPLCWDNVIAGSRSLGYVVATHQSGADHGPTLWTWYRALTGEAAAVRQRLLSLSWEEIAEAVLSDLEVAHRDIRPLVTRIDAMLWGHAMVSPRVGTLLPRREVPPDRGVHHAASDLSGVALFEEAFDHGVRAANDAIAGLHH